MVSLEGRGSQIGHQHSFQTLEDATGSIHSHSADHAQTEKLLQHQPTNAHFFTSPDNITTIPTTWAALLQALMFVVFEVMVFILSDVLKTKLVGGVDPPFALLVSIHVGLWLVTVLIDRYMHYHHRMLRTYGYLDFYTKTKDIRRLPVWILSLGNAVLLVIVSVLGCHKRYGTVSLLHLFKIIVSFELAIALISTFIYIGRIVKFNSARKMPDAFCQDVVDGFTVDMYVTPEVGFRDQDCLDEVLEKQAEMIRYLQQHNSNLGKRIVEMTQQNIQREQRGK